MNKIMRTTPVRDRWLRFSVLRHTKYPGKENHYDIVLEVQDGQDSEEVALVKFETTNRLGSREMSVNHQGMVRRRYLEYVGPMSGDRGKVRRVDSGVYRYTPLDKIEFKGKALSGEYVFDEGAPWRELRSIKDAWLLLKVA